MWKKGSTASARAFSSKELRPAPSTCRVMATRLRWVSITALGRPEVPLENGSTARSHAGSMRTSGGGPASRSSSSKGVAPAASPTTKTSRTAVPCAAARTLSTQDGIVTTKQARVRPSWCASSSAVYSGLAVVTTPPARSTPWKTSAYSGRFGSTTASTSPRPKPRRANAAATRCTPSATCAKLSARPLAPSTKAARSPRAAACARMSAS